MIPNHRLLKRKRQNSGISESYYLPSHLISKVHSDFDIDGEEIFANTLRYSLATIHEWGHWFQHAGTTVGLFLEFLRQSQSTLFMKWVKDQNKATRASIFSDRFSGNKPLIKLDSGGAPSALDLPSDHPLNFVIQAWYDHQFLHEMFLDSTVADEFGMIGAAGFGDVMADVALYCCDDMGFSSQAYNAHGHTIARKWYFHGEDKFPLVAAAGSRVSTKSLMECAATLSEVNYLRGNVLLVADRTDHSKQVADAVHDKLMNSYYGHPVIAFSHLAPDKLFDDEWDRLATLSAVIFAALNPPLPPVHIGPAHGDRIWGWSGIYPPIRFMRLASAVKAVGPLSSGSESSEIAEYIHKLSDAAQTPYFGFSKLLDRPGREGRGVAQAVQMYADGIGKNMINVHQELLLEAYTTLLQHPRKYELCTALGNCFMGPRSPEFTELTFETKMPFDLMKPPLHHTPRDDIGYYGSQAFGMCVCSNVIVNNGYYELACGAQNIDLSMFPTTVRQDSARWQEIVEANIRNFWGLA